MQKMLKILHIFKFILVTFLLVACDMKQPPEELNQDLIYDEVADFKELNTTAPYSHEKFKAILNQSNYQYPHSVTIINHEQYNDFKSEAFYVNEEGDWVFSLKKDFNTIKERSELRQVYKDQKTGKYSIYAGWKTSDKKGNFWIAELRCYKPKITQSYTWMQVHGVNGMDITFVTTAPTDKECLQLLKEFGLPFKNQNK